MKKISLLLIIYIISFVKIHAQLSVGQYTHFPDSKFVGIYWKPQMAIAIDNDVTKLAVTCCNPSTYSDFNEESKLLIRFEDGTVFDCPIDWAHGIEKRYNNEYIQYSGVLNKYYTCTLYNISEQFISKIKNNENIIKIRITFTNGNISDFEIAKGYRKKLTNGLNKSLNQAVSLDSKRKRNMNDEDF